MQIDDQKVPSRIYFKWVDRRVDTGVGLQSLVEDELLCLQIIPDDRPVDRVFHLQSRSELAVLNFEQPDLHSIFKKLELPISPSVPAQMTHLVRPGQNIQVRVVLRIVFNLRVVNLFADHFGPKQVGQSLFWARRVHQLTRCY